MGKAPKCHARRAFLWWDGCNRRSGSGARSYRIVGLFGCVPTETRSITVRFAAARTHCRAMKMVEENGKGWYVPVEAMPGQNVTETSEAALLKELSVPQPLATFTQKLHLSGNYLEIEKKAYVIATGYSPSVFRKFADEASG